MQYLWNTGKQSEKFVEQMVAETGLPIFMADHPVPQEHSTREGYDEGVCILQDLVALCSERKLTKAEYEKASKWWVS
jgi:hypothetical protein